MAGARRWLRHLSARRTTATTLPVILLYHRVADVESDPWGLAVSPRNFRDQMRMLAEDHLCISLDDLVRDRAVGNGRVCITFDDGYSDNLVNAKPILDEFSIPATFFLTSGYLRGDKNFWWDALEWPFFQRTRIPSILEIQIHHTSLVFDFTGDTEYRASAFAEHRHWRAWDPPLSKRHLAYHQLWQALHEASGSTRETALDAIRNWAANTDAAVPDCRPLSSGQVRQLASGTMIEVGGHSVTHPALPLLTCEEQKSEINENKLRLEELLGRPLRHFAYPHGQLSPDTVSLVKQAGYESACTSAAGPVDDASDAFHLPRICVEDWGKDEFARRLACRFAD